MKATQILDRKGRDVATIATTATIKDAVSELATHGIGALVVSDDGETVQGILSERDVVRRLGTDGAAVLERPVSDLMKAAVTTCSSESTTDDLMSMMTEGRFRHVPVVDGGKLSGIVSIGDVVKVRIEELAEEAEQLASYIQSG